MFPVLRRLSGLCLLYVLAVPDLGRCVVCRGAPRWCRHEQCADDTPSHRDPDDSVAIGRLSGANLPPRPAERECFDASRERQCSGQTRECFDASHRTGVLRRPPRMILFGPWPFRPQLARIPAPLPTNRLSPHGRSRGRDRVVRCVARKRGETMVEHELRLVEFFLYIMRLEAQRLREDLLTTLARQGRQPAHTLATGLREALTDMLLPPADGTPGSARAFALRWHRALLVILPRGSEGGAAAEES